MSRFSHLLLSAIAVTPFVHSLAVPKDLHSVSNQILNARAPIAFQAGDLISFENGKLFRRENETAPFEVFEEGSGPNPVERKVVVKRATEEQKTPSWKPSYEEEKKNLGEHPDGDDLEDAMIARCGDIGWVKLAESMFASGASGSLTKGITKENKILAMKGMKEKDKSQAEWDMMQKVGDHDNIVKAQAQCKKFGVLFYYAMDLVEGQPLSERIKAKQFTTEAAEKPLKLVMQQIFSAIEQMHDKGVAHCDIKGDNILITKADKPVVIDMGEATTEKQVEKIEVAGGIRSPEAETQSTKEIDPKANDVWELGTLLVSLLLGKQPWGKATDDNAKAIWIKEAPKLRKEACAKEWPDFSDDFCDVLADIFAQQLSRKPLSAVAKKITNPNLKFWDKCKKDKKKEKREIQRGEMVVTDVDDTGDELVVRALMY